MRPRLLLVLLCSLCLRDAWAQTATPQDALELIGEAYTRDRPLRTLRWEYSPEHEAIIGEWRKSDMYETMDALQPAMDDPASGVRLRPYTETVEHWDGWVNHAAESIKLGVSGQPDIRTSREIWADREWATVPRGDDPIARLMAFETPHTLEERMGFWEDGMAAFEYLNIRGGWTRRVMATLEFIHDAPDLELVEIAQTPALRRLHSPFWATSIDFDPRTGEVRRLIVGTPKGTFARHEAFGSIDDPGMRAPHPELVRTSGTIFGEDAFINLHRYLEVEAGRPGDVSVGDDPTIYEWWSYADEAVDRVTHEQVLARNVRTGERSEAPEPMRLSKPKKGEDLPPELTAPSPAPSTDTGPRWSLWLGIAGGALVLGGLGYSLARRG